MSTVGDILKRYNAKVPFPVTPEKISSAGYDLERYLQAMISDIRGAEDSQDPGVQEFLRQVEGLLPRPDFT